MIAKPYSSTPTKWKFLGLLQLMVVVAALYRTDPFQMDAHDVRHTFEDTNESPETG